MLEMFGSTISAALARSRTTIGLAFTSDEYVKLARAVPPTPCLCVLRRNGILRGLDKNTPAHWLHQSLPGAFGNEVERSAPGPDIAVFGCDLERQQAWLPPSNPCITFVAPLPR
eukprot:SAG11_NODE_1470_length_4847_cov_2.253791_1_plen_114_part_00